MVFLVQVLYSVPSDHSSGFKEFLLYQYTLEGYKAEGGKQLFLDCFNTTFAVDKRAKIVEDFRKFTQCKREDGKAQWFAIGWLVLKMYFFR